MNFKKTTCALSCVVLASCASIRGIPVGLTDADTVDLRKGRLEESLKVAAALAKAYDTARNDNLEYVFWSNVSFIPLAGVAAGAVAFNAYKDLLAGVGIAAGSIAGLNTFINGRANAGVYLSGRRALRCIDTRLYPYIGKTSEALAREADALALDLSDAQQVLADAAALKFDTPQQLAEIKANPLVITALAASQQTLTHAIADAQKALGDAQTEVVFFDDIAAFATDRILQVDNLVATRITQPDISFSGLQTSILTLTKVPAAAPKPGAGVAPASAPPPPPPASNTPILDATNRAVRSAQQLAASATALNLNTRRFGLSEAMKAVDDCIKGS